MGRLTQKYVKEIVETYNKKRGMNINISQESGANGGSLFTPYAPTVGLKDRKKYIPNFTGIETGRRICNIALEHVQ